MASAPFPCGGAADQNRSPDVSLPSRRDRPDGTRGPKRVRKGPQGSLRGSERVPKGAEKGPQGASEGHLEFVCFLGAFFEGKMIKN